MNEKQTQREWVSVMRESKILFLVTNTYTEREKMNSPQTVNTLSEMKENFLWTKINELKRVCYKYSDKRQFVELYKKDNLREFNKCKT